MNKILLIIQREYLTRVRKRSFLIMTLLGPLLVAALYGGAIYLAVKSDDMASSKTIAVLNPDKTLVNAFSNTEKLNFTPINLPLAAAKDSFIKSKYDYLLYLNSAIDDTLLPPEVKLFTKKQASIGISNVIENQLENYLKNQTLMARGIDTAIINQAQPTISITTTKLSASGEENSSAGLNFALAMIGAVGIYMSVLLYGVQTMRGVIEEKTNRVVEIIISSVKPFQLLMGKIIGVGAVGLTQFVLWIGLSALFSSLLGSSISNKVLASSSINANEASVLGNMGAALDAQNLMLLALCFLFYFLIGYLMYAAIFAAVGSAADSETETQQFVMPITIPLIFAFIISTSSIVQNPDSDLAFWTSIIPFTSPICMMARLPFGVPTWQIILSMSLLIIGFVSMVALSARIYRVGILMYGKKTGFKELGKWLFIK